MSLTDTEECPAVLKELTNCIADLEGAKSRRSKKTSFLASSVLAFAGINSIFCLRKKTAGFLKKQLAFIIKMIGGLSASKFSENRKSEHGFLGHSFTL